MYSTPQKKNVKTKKFFNNQPYKQLSQASSPQILIHLKLLQKKYLIDLTFLTWGQKKEVFLFVLRVILIIPDKLVN